MSDDLNHFSSQQLEIIDRKIRSLLNKRMRKIRDPRYVYLDNADFLNLLSISRRTAENWRRQNLIPFSRINQKIYYRLSDIIRMMEDHLTHKKKINP